jgi:hypothetical protein
MDMEYNITWLTQDVCRVIVTGENQEEMATLYFERPKRTWTNKPVMSNTSFSCVDAVVLSAKDTKGAGLYDQTDMTPKDLVRICQELIATDIQKIDNKDGDGQLN